MNAVRDFNTEHVKCIKAAMDELVNAGVDDGFIIFESDEGKFLQFTYSKGEGLTFDLPRMGLSEEELSRVCKVEGLEAMNETELSFLLQIGVDTRMGARLANCIFRIGLRLPRGLQSTGHH